MKKYNDQQKTPDQEGKSQHGHLENDLKQALELCSRWEGSREKIWSGIVSEIKRPAPWWQRRRKWALAAALLMLFLGGTGLFRFLDQSFPGAAPDNGMPEAESKIMADDSTDTLHIEETDTPESSRESDPTTDPFYQKESETPDKLADLLPVKPAEVKKLLIRDGTTGEAIITTSSEDIYEFFSILESAPILKQTDIKQKAGWIYYADLYKTRNEEDSFFRITIRGANIVSLGQVSTTSSYQFEESLHFDLDQNITEEITAYYHSLKKRDG